MSKGILCVITPVQLDAHPEHPIEYPPEGGGGQPPETGDAHPEHPIYYPTYPAHPIELPSGGGEQPPTGGAPPHPSHPIYPGEHPEHPIVIPPTPEVTDKFDVKVGWTEETGWVVVLVPKGDHPVPSEG